MQNAKKNYKKNTGSKRIAGKNTQHIRAILLITGIIWMTVMTGGLFAGCSFTGARKEKTVVATCFPGYDMAKNILRYCDDIEIRMLLKPGTEGHTYDPSADDIIAVRNSAVMVAAGGDADSWSEKIVSSIGESTELNVFTMWDCVELTDIEGEDEKDPHVWTSPRNAVKIAGKMKENFLETDAFSENRAEIEKGADEYIKELEMLDGQYRAALSAVPEEKRILVFGDRYPFRYLAAEYGIKAYAAFPGCASETEPSAATVASLVDIIQKNNIKTVLYVDYSNHRVADSIAEITGSDVKMLISCHNLSAPDFNAGKTYISIMEDNLKIILEAMN